ncbi:MAG: methyltransferase domain-containing protein [Deltaproteobacteria bacterium]|nr:methyltransferase domain-containing protein [Deltaproteobacteria bacterium]
MKHHIAFIKELVAKGGPDSSEYQEFTDWVKTVSNELKNGILGKEDLQLLRNEMGEALSILTLQGFVFNKPHGYPGDYEIIEKIYLEHTSNDPELRKWDLYFQLQKAPIAVKNRKKYFLDLLNSLESLNQTNSKRVLNVASGPARDLFDFFSLKNDRTMFFDNVEFDPLAISYAKNLCKDFLKNIEFLHTNAFDFTTDKRYRLIWSAGLFDYLNDKKFIFLLNHLIPLLENDGELVVGNFSSSNPTQAYMEVIGDWQLKHRTPDQLVSLAKACKFKDTDIRIGREPEGVNLFLHLKCGKDFIPQ